MNKKILLILFLLFSIYIIYSIPRPRKNKEVGALIGRFTLQGDASWKVNLYIKNNESNKIYLLELREGIFSKFNLIPGNYTLFQAGISKSSGDYQYWASDLMLNEYSINIEIEPYKITVVTYLEMYLNTNMYTKRFNYGFSKNYDDLKEYYANIKDYFESWDKRGLWKDFEWIGIEKNVYTDDKEDAGNDKYYIVREENIRLEASPEANGRLIRRLKLGEKLEFIKEGKAEMIKGTKSIWISGIWRKVKTEQGEIGWCFDAYLEEVK